MYIEWVQLPPSESSLNRCFQNPKLCTAVEHTPHESEDVGSNPDWCWAFFSLLYPISCASLIRSPREVQHYWFNYKICYFSGCPRFHGILGLGAWHPLKQFSVSDIVSVQDTLSTGSRARTKQLSGLANEGLLGLAGDGVVSRAGWWSIGLGLSYCYL